MKVLVTGATGQIGSRILTFVNEKHEAIAAGRRHVSGALNTHGNFKNVYMDLCDEKSIVSTVKSEKPDAVIHSAALTSPEKCEDDKDLCQNTNVEGSKTLAKACADIGAKMIYISTDLVFDGEKGDYTENDAPNPLNYYAESKLEGEIKILEQMPEAIIARTAIVYGRGAFSEGGFASWLIGSLRRGEKIFLFTDQFRSHFYIEDCARAVSLLLEGEYGGLYHLSSGEKQSRYDFGMAVAETLGLDKSLITPITMDEKPSAAKRPKDVSLSNAKLVRDTDFKPTPLAEGLKLLKEAF